MLLKKIHEIPEVGIFPPKVRSLCGEFFFKDPHYVLNSLEQFTYKKSAFSSRIQPAQLVFRAARPSKDERGSFSSDPPVATHLTTDYTQLTRRKAGKNLVPECDNSHSGRAHISDEALNVMSENWL